MYVVLFQTYNFSPDSPSLCWRICSSNFFHELKSTKIQWDCQSNNLKTLASKAARLVTSLTPRLSCTPFTASIIGINTMTKWIPKMSYRLACSSILMRSVLRWRTRFPNSTAPVQAYSYSSAYVSASSNDTSFSVYDENGQRFKLFVTHLLIY